MGRMKGRKGRVGEGEGEKPEEGQHELNNTTQKNVLIAHFHF